MVYLLNYPRPIGVEPKIYRTKPQLDESESGTNPWAPELMEFDSELMARIFITNSLGMDVTIEVEK